MEGIAVPPQRLLVLVPSLAEYKSIAKLLACDTQMFSFSKKLDISGLVVPSFVHAPDSNALDREQQESMQEAPGEQNRLYIVRCGAGLVNVALAVATVVQTVGIDAI